MRNDERFEIQRAFDLLPHVVGASWTAVWFRMQGIRKPTREEFRKKTLEYLKMVEPVFESYPKEEDFEDITLFTPPSDLGTTYLIEYLDIFDRDKDDD